MNLLAHPIVFRTVASLRNRQLSKSRWIMPNTDLLIEGFPRSANTFFMRIIRAATKSQLRIASHVHRPEQISMAAHYGVPGIVIFRDPLECVASLVVRNSGYEISDNLKLYQSFCRKALDADPNRILLLDFTAVIESPGHFAEAVLAHFDIPHVPIDAELIVQSTQDQRKVQTTSSLPNAQKDAMKAEVYDEIRADPNFAMAVDLFQEVMVRRWHLPEAEAAQSA